MKKSYTKNFAFDEPCEYNGIKIYPILLKEYMLFNYLVDCFLIDKNSLPDVKAISMNYLDYLVESHSEQNNNVEKLLTLLHISTKCDMNNIKIGRNEHGHIFILLNDVVINGDDFDEIKAIILEQNLVDVPDYSIQKEIRDKIEEGRRIKNRMNKHKFASLEDQMVSLSMSSGIPLEDIYTMTYRKFMKSITRMDLLLHYKIYLQASMSGMVEFKDKSFIKHWLNEIESNKNDDMVELDAMKSKINFEDKKK